MQNQVVNTKGEPAGKIDLPDAIFAAKGNPKLLAQAVRVYLSNKRHASPKVKTRGEVSGSGRKIWRQKGTGRARHGDAYAPIFVGGGIAHGPTGRENHKMKLSKVLRRKALLLALTQKLEAQELLVVDGLEEVKPKTKEMNRVVKKLAGDAKTVSLIVPEGNRSITRGARNIEGLHLLSVRTLNAYDILRGGKILVPKTSLAVIKDTFLTRAGEPEVKRKPRKETRPLPKQEMIKKETQRKVKTRTHQEKRRRKKNTR